MQEPGPLYKHVRSIMLEIGAILYVNGHTALHIGAMMRLIGVDNEIASQYDKEQIELDDTFVKQIASELAIQNIMRSGIPPGVTVH